MPGSRLRESRLTARLRALGLPLLAALLILAASLWAFGAIAEELLEGDTGYDQRLADWLHGHATETRTDVFHVLTWMGNFSTLLVVALLAAGILWRRGERTDTVFIVLALAGAQVLSTGMKLGFQRDRPFFPDPLSTESTYSFPERPFARLARGLRLDRPRARPPFANSRAAGGAARRRRRAGGGDRL